MREAYFHYVLKPNETLTNLEKHKENNNATPKPISMAPGSAGLPGCYLPQPVKMTFKNTSRNDYLRYKRQAIR